MSARASDFATFNRLLASAAERAMPLDLALEGIDEQVRSRSLSRAGAPSGVGVL